MGSASQKSSAVPTPYLMSRNLIRISGWKPLSEDAEGLSGACRKDLVRLPDEPDAETPLFLHRRLRQFQQPFLFKYPARDRMMDPRENWKRYQIWSEALASFIAGDVFGWDVQRVGVAERNGVHGTLHAFMYRSYFDDGDEEHSAGDDLSTYASFDQETGENQDGQETYTLESLWETHKQMSRNGSAPELEDFQDCWARIFALDSLLSNTDRHGGNWGTITGQDRRTGSSHVRMSPIFDNASSLGLGFLTDDKFVEAVTVGGGGVRIDRDLLKAELQLRWRKRRYHHRVQIGPLGQMPERKYSYEEVNAEFLRQCPQGRKRFEEAAEFDIGEVRDVIHAFQQMVKPEESACALTDMHSDFICAMLEIGRERIRVALQGNTA